MSAPAEIKSTDLTPEAQIQEATKLLSEALSVLKTKNHYAETAIEDYIASPQKPRSVTIKFPLAAYRYAFVLSRKEDTLSFHLSQKPIQQDLNQDEISISFTYDKGSEIKEASFGYTRTLHNIEFLPETIKDNTDAAGKIRSYLAYISSQKQDQPKGSIHVEIAT